MFRWMLDAGSQVTGHEDSSHSWLIALPVDRSINGLAQTPITERLPEPIPFPIRAEQRIEVEIG